MDEVTSIIRDVFYVLTLSLVFGYNDFNRACFRKIAKYLVKIDLIILAPYGN